MTQRYYSTYTWNGCTKLIDDKDKAKIIVELGARDCVDTLDLEKIYPNALVYAIECNPKQIDICKNNLKKTTRTTFIDKAITNFTGEKKFYSATIDNVGISSLYESVNRSHLFQETRVQCITGKCLFEEYNFNHIDVLCMDIQGGEYDALVSFEDYINNINYIILEDDSHAYKLSLEEKNGTLIEKDIHRLLKENNFELVQRFNQYGRDFLYKRKL